MWNFIDLDLTGISLKFQYWNSRNFKFLAWSTLWTPWLEFFCKFCKIFVKWMRKSWNFRGPRYMNRKNMFVKFGGKLLLFHLLANLPCTIGHCWTRLLLLCHSYVSSEVTGLDHQGAFHRVVRTTIITGPRTFPFVEATHAGGCESPQGNENQS